jgi:hypothetical protein
MPPIVDEIIRSGLEFSRVLSDRVAALVRNVYIHGIEATQTIQYFSSSEHLTDPVTRGVDNAVVLAAFKPAWVRVYVRSARVGDVHGVTGRLRVERRRLGFLWDPVATLIPQAPGSVTAHAMIDYATERGSAANTLNFVIPAADCHGNLRLTATLVDAKGGVLHMSVAFAKATLVQTLRLRGIMIAYNGPSTWLRIPGAPPPPTINIAAPTLADLQTTSARALLAMPVQSTGNIALAGAGITLSVPLDDPRTSAGACSVNWGTLLTQLATQRTNDGNRSDVVYFGLLPATVPIGVPGCGNDGLGAGRIGDMGTLLHEIGHGYGFAHTPCGPGGATDPNYPNYTPYPPASIGEYGLDISTGNVFSPQTTADYMSYCFPQWMSLYQHYRLVGHTRLAPSWIEDHPLTEQYLPKPFSIPEDVPDPPGDPWMVAQMRPESVISIIGTMRSETEVEVTSVARVRSVPRPPGLAVSLQARLLDEDGRELARAALYDLAAQGGCGCGGCGDRQPGEPPYAFQAFVPDVAPGTALVIGEGEGVIWERRASSTPPRVGAVRAEVTPDSAVRVAWEADVEGESGTVWLQWSERDGKVWHGLATDLTGSEAHISLAGLPAGDVLLRVLVHDGFHTAVSEPVQIEVPRQPPAVAILSPSDGQAVMAGHPMRLWAAVTDSAGTPLLEDVLLWLIDAQEVGRGADVWITAPTAGEHRATLLVRGEEEEELRVSTRFTSITVASVG